MFRSLAFLSLGLLNGMDQGLVDVDVEIAKCTTKLDLAKMGLSKVLKVESQADYEETVPANVRLMSEEKVRFSFIPFCSVFD